MRSLWMGLVVLGVILLPVGSSAGVTISPDYLYKDMPVTINYPALTIGQPILIGFDDGFTPQTTGIQGLTASSIVVPFSLDPGTITSVEGVLFNNSTQLFLSDMNGTVEPGTYGLRVLKAVSTTGSPVNLSWMVGGFISKSASAGQITFTPRFTPQAGMLNVTVRVGNDILSKPIPYNQSIAAPAVTSPDVSLVAGQSGYGNISISGLTTGLSLYNLTIGLKNGAVGNFTNVTAPSGVNLEIKSPLPSSVLTVNATTSMKNDDVTLVNALNVTFNSLVAGSSPINVTINSLKDKNGFSLSPVLVKNGTLTVNPPPLPGAEFIGTPTTGIIPFNVSFLCASPDTLNVYNWSFDDGSANATIWNPTHTYWVEGTHDVTLTVQGATDNNTKFMPDYINARQVEVWFMGNITSGSHPLSVCFNGSTNSARQSWVYQFGDGWVGYEQNMTHTYDVPGVYTVRAQAMMDGSHNSAVRYRYITVW